MPWTRPRLIAAAAMVLLFGAAGYYAIWARPSYEMALLAGLLCPSVAALSTCRDRIDDRLAGPRAFFEALKTGALIAIAAYAAAFVHGVVRGFCDLGPNTLSFFLGAGIGTCLGSLWGLVAAEMVVRVARGGKWRGRLSAIAFPLIGPVGSALLNLAIFYASPVVFAFDPFVGYFSGAIYDTVLDRAPLYTYRAASAATVFACYVVACHIRRDEGGALVFVGGQKPVLRVAGVAAVAFSLGSVIFGHTLGHWHFKNGIADILGGEWIHGRCRVVHDRSIEADRIKLFARDCDAHAAELAAWLGAEDTKPVTVFLFASAAQKRSLMGAGRTSVAKPWRREVYVHDAPYPHRVIRHELAHALAGEFARGPFAIAGRMGGWLPNPGLIEGLAVAAAPRDGDLSTDEWAAAMMRIDRLPSLNSLFGLSFFGRNSGAGYTAAGSFVAYIRRHHGAATIRRWYGGADLIILTSASWPELERRWRGDLDALALSEAALDAANMRFDRPSVLGRRCPHVVDERLVAAGSALGRRDPGQALQSFRHVISLDPGNVHALFGVAECYDRLHEDKEAERALEALSRHAALSVTRRQSAVERLGDRALRRGAVEAAKAHYQKARRSVVNGDRLRTLDLKTHYAAIPSARAALVALLIGTTSHGSDQVEALDLLGRWRSAMPDDGTPDYLFARQHLHLHHLKLAAESLERALQKGLPVVRAMNETLRLRLVVACALSDAATARATFKRYRKQPGLPAARRAAAALLLARCTR